MLTPTIIRDQKSFATGLLYIVVGIAFSIGALNYNMGSAARMGPAYFPFWLGLLLAAIGVIVVANSLRAGAVRDALPHFDWKLLAWIISSVVLYGVMLPHLGMVISVLVLVLLASRASHEFTWKGAVLNALFLLTVCLGTFIYGLDMQLPLWPTFLD